MPTNKRPSGRLPNSQPRSVSGRFIKAAPPKRLTKISKGKRIAAIIGAIMLFLGIVGAPGIADQTTATDKYLYAIFIGLFILIGIALIVPVARILFQKPAGDSHEN